jgi:hypothetical protein
MECPKLTEEEITKVYKVLETQLLKTSKEEKNMLHDVCNEYKKENEKLKKKIAKLEKVNNLHHETIDEYEREKEECYMCFYNEDEVQEMVENEIQKYIDSGHITSTINDTTKNLYQ